MAAVTRTGGTVKTTKWDAAAGYSALVHYPEPLPDGVDLPYTGLSDGAWAQLCRAQEHGKVVDVTVEDTTNNVTAVAVR